MTFTIMPAIDLLDGRVVRLKQGDYARQTRYADNPYTLARHYADAGVRWLHLVDLEGARAGSMTSLAVIEAIAHDGIQVQAGGGVRSEADVRCLFDAGAARVVLGSMAIVQPERVVDLLHREGVERFTLALDVRCIDGRWVLPSAGWTQKGLQTLDALAPWYATQGVCHLLCTDISRDGMMTGLNISLYRYLADTLPSLAVQASGGVRNLEDIRAVRKAGAQAVILGRALLEGCFTVAEALAC